MITSSGAICDVCGKYILPIGDEMVNPFSVAQIPQRELHACNKCRAIVENCNGDWHKLPDGPLRQAYEAAQASYESRPTANLWFCPVCGHRMTTEESKNYRGCPSGVHLAQHEPYDEGRGFIPDEAWPFEH